MKTKIGKIFFRYSIGATLQCWVDSVPENPLVLESYIDVAAFLDIRTYRHLQVSSVEAGDAAVVFPDDAHESVVVPHKAHKQSVVREQVREGCSTVHCLDLVHNQSLVRSLDRAGEHDSADEYDAVGEHDRAGEHVRADVLPLPLPVALAGTVVA